MNAFVAATCLSMLMLAGSSAAAQDLFKEGDRIANEGTIGDKWMLAEGETLEMASYPAQFADRGANVCIGLGYRIETDGRTGNFAVLKQWSSEADEDEPEPGFWQAFAEASADAVSQWRFAPRPGVSPDPTYTVATIVFNGKTQGAGTAGHCKVGDLATVVQELKSRKSRRSTTTHDIERANRTQQAGRAMNENPGRMGSKKPR